MKFKTTIQAFIILALTILMLLLPAYALSKTSVSPAQLTALAEVLESKRLEHHIPGMAIAVVKDDQIIMSQGFGMMNLTEQEPVKPDTLFAIGSSSKAFTATLVGMLADQGKIDWDDEISQYIPNYQFQVDGKTLPITIRDMLSHRTGYTRNDILWANGQASKQAILTTAPKAEPWDDFRDSFHYNNVMFLAAGEAAAQQAGTTWDQLLTEKIFKPLGMKASTSIHEQAIKNSKIALGYQWDDATETHELLPRRNLNNVSPAGGIYSNVNDMAQWVRFQLNQGQFNGQQLISKDQLLTTHQSQNKVADGVNYGLGWFLRQWQGQPVVEHGGNIDGYGAQVALLPESNLGYVLLTNITATPLQQESMYIVWEHLVGLPKEATKETTVAELDYHEFVGEYHANFASFKDAIFTFLVKEDGKPAVDVPGQTVYELKDPDASGKWYFTITDTIAVSFDRATDGSIAAMRMHQNRLDFELPRKGVEIIPEVDVETLQPYLGQYQSKVFNGTVDVIIQNHRLTLDVPNEMAFELHLPDAEGFRQFRIKSDMSAVFETNDQDEVTAVLLYRNKEKLIDTAVKKQGKAQALPTVADIMTLRKTKKRKKALKKKTDFVLSGTINMLNAGVEGQMTTHFDNQLSYRQHMDFGGFGEIIVVANEDGAATYGINPYTEFHGKYLQQIRKDHPAVTVDWRDHYETVKVMGVNELDDKKVYVMRLKDPGIPSVTLYVDVETGDVLQYKTKLLNPTIGSITVTIRYDDYREMDGLRLPFKTTIKNPMMGKTLIVYDTFKAKQKLKADVFSLKQP